tara:strand:+ start:923 stop:1261 length:339 start_codon:yes stop_codon:yes gene_type:complete
MRYSNRKIIRNLTEDYSHEERSQYKGVTGIDHYTSPIIPYPSLEDMATMRTLKRIWKTGDRLYKYADEYYDSPKHWWIIAWFNSKPTEAHFKNGDVFYIPVPLSHVLGFIGY